MAGEPLKTKVDLGCNFYCQARVPDPSMVMVAVGLGFFLELTLEEALKCGTAPPPPLSPLH